ncbi:MAG: RNA polymerase sigma factor [Acidobacteriia bacterium]|nr:RNA polymerase sigma factor [Terriglobia bacterium]
MRTVFRKRWKNQNAGIEPAESQDFGVQILEHLESLFGYAIALTKDIASAQDLVQETVLRAIKNAESWQAHSNLKAWLFTIQRNAWINECHRRQHAVEFSSLSISVEDLWGSPKLRGDLPNGDMSSEHAWLRHEVQAAVEALSPGHREVVLLRDFEGFDYKEIAKIVGVPIGTVMSRLNRARSELRKRLQHLNQRKGGPVSNERL